MLFMNQDIWTKTDNKPSTTNGNHTIYNNRMHDIYYVLHGDNGIFFSYRNYKRI